MRRKSDLRFINVERMMEDYVDKTGWTMRENKKNSRIDSRISYKRLENLIFWHVVSF